jgi:hypothetical protein
MDAYFVRLLRTLGMVESVEPDGRAAKKFRTPSPHPNRHASRQGIQARHTAIEVPRILALECPLLHLLREGCARVQGLHPSARFHQVPLRRLRRRNQSHRPEGELEREAFKLVKADKKLVRFYLSLVPKKPDDAGWSVIPTLSDEIGEEFTTFLRAIADANPLLKASSTGSTSSRKPKLNRAPIDENCAWARFTLQLQGWSAPREFFAIRERIRENKSAVGRRLIDVDGYTFRVFVTNRQGDGAELWRDYNQRACCEQHIEELKNDLQAEGFRMKDFYATESAFLSVCFTYNLLSLYQHATAPEQRKAGCGPEEKYCAA